MSTVSVLGQYLATCLMFTYLLMLYLFSLQTEDSEILTVERKRLSAINICAKQGVQYCVTILAVIQPLSPSHTPTAVFYPEGYLTAMQSLQVWEKLDHFQLESLSLLEGNSKVMVLKVQGVLGILSEVSFV